MHLMYYMDAVRLSHSATGSICGCGGLWPRRLTARRSSGPVSGADHRDVDACLQEGKRVYTLLKVAPDGEATKSAHPARFSPDDKFSRHRITLKKRFNLLPTQQEEEKL